MMPIHQRVHGKMHGVSNKFLVIQPSRDVTAPTAAASVEKFFPRVLFRNAETSSTLGTIV